MEATGGQYHLKDYVFIALNCFTSDSIDVNKITNMGPILTDSPSA